MPAISFGRWTFILYQLQKRESYKLANQRIIEKGLLCLIKSGVGLIVETCMVVYAIVV